jgi:hypothetical protein
VPRRWPGFDPRPDLEVVRKNGFFYNPVSGGTFSSTAIEIINRLTFAVAKAKVFPHLEAWGAIHQLFSVILKLRILVLLPVSTMPYVVKVKNYS